VLWACRIIDTAIDEIISRFKNLCRRAVGELQQVQSKSTDAFMNQEMTRLLRANQENSSSSYHELKPLNSIIGYLICFTQTQNTEVKDTFANSLSAKAMQMVDSYCGQLTIHWKFPVKAGKWKLQEKIQQMCCLN